jgi:hypothetical protein
MGLSIFDEVQPYDVVATLNTASGIIAVSVAPQTTTPRRLDNILVTNSDVIAHVVTLLYVDSGISIVLGSWSIPAGQGYVGTPGVDLLAAVLPSTQVGLACRASVSFSLQLAVVMGATAVLGVVVNGGYL